MTCRAASSIALSVGNILLLCDGHEVEMTRGYICSLFGSCPLLLLPVLFRLCHTLSVFHKHILFLKYLPPLPFRRDVFVASLQRNSSEEATLTAKSVGDPKHGGGGSSVHRRLKSPVILFAKGSGSIPGQSGSITGLQHRRCTRCSGCRRPSE